MKSASNEVCSNAAEIREHPRSIRSKQFRLIDKSYMVAIQNAFFTICLSRSEIISIEQSIAFDNYTNYILITQ